MQTTRIALGAVAFIAFVWLSRAQIPACVNQGLASFTKPSRSVIAANVSSCDQISICLPRTSRVEVVPYTVRVTHTLSASPLTSEYTTHARRFSVACHQLDYAETMQYVLPYAPADGGKVGGIHDWNWAASPISYWRNDFTNGDENPGYTATAARLSSCPTCKVPVPITSDWLDDNHDRQWDGSLAREAFTCSESDVDAAYPMGCGATGPYNYYLRKVGFVRSDSTPVSLADATWVISDQQEFRDVFPVSDTGLDNVRSLTVENLKAAAGDAVITALDAYTFVGGRSASNILYKRHFLLEYARDALPSEDLAVRCSVPRANLTQYFLRDTASPLVNLACQAFGVGCNATAPVSAYSWDDLDGSGVVGVVHVGRPLLGMSWGGHSFGWVPSDAVSSEVVEGRVFAPAGVLLKAAPLDVMVALLGQNVSTLAADMVHLVSTEDGLTIDYTFNVEVSSSSDGYSVSLGGEILSTDVALVTNLTGWDCPPAGVDASWCPPSPDTDDTCSLTGKVVYQYCEPAPYYLCGDGGIYSEDGLYLMADPPTTPFLTCEDADGAVRSCSAFDTNDAFPTVGAAMLCSTGARRRRDAAVPLGRYPMNPAFPTAPTTTTPPTTTASGLTPAVSGGAPASPTCDVPPPVDSGSLYASRVNQCTINGADACSVNAGAYGCGFDVYCYTGSPGSYIPTYLYPVTDGNGCFTEAMSYGICASGVCVAQRRRRDADTVYGAALEFTSSITQALGGLDVAVLDASDGSLQVASTLNGALLSDGATLARNQHALALDLSQSISYSEMDATAMAFSVVRLNLAILHNHALIDILIARSVAQSNQLQILAARTGLDGQLGTMVGDSLLVSDCTYSATFVPEYIFRPLVQTSKGQYCYVTSYDGQFLHLDECQDTKPSIVVKRYVLPGLVQLSSGVWTLTAPPSLLPGISVQDSISSILAELERGKSLVSDWIKRARSTTSTDFSVNVNDTAAVGRAGEGFADALASALSQLERSHPSSSWGGSQFGQIGEAFDSALKSVAKTADDALAGFGGGFTGILMTVVTILSVVAAAAGCIKFGFWAFDRSRGRVGNSYQ